MNLRKSAVFCENLRFGFSLSPYLKRAQSLGQRGRKASLKDALSIGNEKMRTNFFGTNFLNTRRGLGHPDKIPGTYQIPFFETQGRQTFKGEHELFDPHPFAWKTPTPPGGLRTQKVNLCALFSCLNLHHHLSATPADRRGDQGVL